MKNWLLVFTVIGAFEACQTKSVDTTNTIQIGKSWTIGRRVIVFDSVRDSRCAAELQCVWAGNAACYFTMIEGGTSTGFVLNTFDNPPTFLNEAVIGGCSIRLMNVTPYPSTVARFSSDAYAATVKVDCR